MIVGIMTMHRVPNYGSFLQAYSLKKIIESLGHDVIFVDYHADPDIMHRGDMIEGLHCKVRQMKQAVKSTLLGRMTKRILKGEDVSPRSVMFSCNGMLGLSDKYRYNMKCDVLVIGSDEVFNCLQLGPNVGYSLELFGRRANADKVVSYAASFGNTTLEKLERYGVAQEIGECLKEFDEVSVRDANSYSIVQKLTGETPQLHLDPVLVGGAELENWGSCEDSKFVILYGYSFRFSKEECEKALKFAHDRGLELIALGEDQLGRDRHVRCRPDQVLSYFRSAEYVITDTFHGSIFSVVTHTPFVTIPRGDKNGQGGNIEKLTYLLKHLGLLSRCIDSMDSLADAFAEDVNFEEADVIRHAEALRSREYLKSCLMSGCASR